MKKSNGLIACYWHCRFEIVGIILLALATFLTLITLSDFGIFAMFLVGGALCCFKYWTCNPCDVCHPDEMVEGSKGSSVKTTAKKSPVKKAATSNK